MTPAVIGAEPRRRASAPAFLLTRDETVDALILLALTLIGIVGFRDAYGGHDYLIAGAAGALLGVAVSHGGHRARVPLLTVGAISVLAFLLLGVLVAQTGAAVKIPTLATIHEVVGASIHGWKQLLTTARPVGTASHLLVLPYLLGITCAVAGHALARRTSRYLLPATAPAAVVALSILFGADHATAAVLQGATFAALALAWAALRQRRGTDQVATIGRQRPWQRLGAALAVLAIAGAGATVVGPHLPGANSHQRVVLHAIPPFEVNAYPSPLAMFRDYTKAAAPSVSIYGKQLLATTGLPTGSRVRIATMDSYDGLVWTVANAAAGTSSFAGFQRIGSTLPGASSASSTARAVTITIRRTYQQPWLPDLAGTTGLAFAGSAGHALQDTLWFNVATATGIVPGGVPAGLRYTVSVAEVPAPTAAQLSNATPYGAPDASIVIPPAIGAFANAHAASAGSPIRKVLMLAAYLKDSGHYSDGGAGHTDIRAGHSSGRLTAFLQSPQIVGDDEQYAGAMALLANAVGVPARVAIDGTVEADGSVYGRDVHADIELHLAQYGWVTLPADQFVGTRKPAPQQQKAPHPSPAKVVPPPVSNVAPATSESNNESNNVSRNAPAKPGLFHLPAFVVAILQYIGIPLLALALIAGTLAGAKSLRRRRRRRHGPAAARVTGAWRELLDLGRDLGIVPAKHATRREHAEYAARHGFGHVATAAVATDAAIFGREVPDDAAADRVWTLVEEARRGAIADLTRWRRAWVALNPASLWASRAVARRLLLPSRDARTVMIRPRRPGLHATGIHR